MNKRGKSWKCLCDRNGNFLYSLRSGKRIFGMFVCFSGEQKLHRRLSAERASGNNNDDVAEEAAAPAAVFP